MTNKEKHYRLWNWLAENPKMEKEDWPEWDFKGGEVPEIENLCFACEEANEGGRRDCKKCPVKWYDEEPRYSNEVQCLGHGSTYRRWYYSIAGRCDIKERAALALQIRDAWK